MQAFSPISGARKTQTMRAGEMSVVRRSAADVRLRLFFRPSVLALLSLAFVVGACGYAFKLNQYQHLFELSKPSAVRMWFEHRDDSFKAFSQYSLRSQKPPATKGFAAAVAQPTQQVGWSRGLALVLPASHRPAFLVSSLIPFRAPPISHSSLA